MDFNDIFDFSMKLAHMPLEISGAIICAYIDTIAQVNNMESKELLDLICTFVNEVNEKEGRIFKI